VQLERRTVASAQARLLRPDSEDGPGQNNPDRSEGPWGRAAKAARTEVLKRATSSDTVQGKDAASEAHEGRTQTVRRDDRAVDGKAPSDIPALKP